MLKQFLLGVSIAMGLQAQNLEASSLTLNHSVSPLMVAPWSPALRLIIKWVCKPAAVGVGTCSAVVAYLVVPDDLLGADCSEAVRQATQEGAANCQPTLGENGPLPPGPNCFNEGYCRNLCSQGLRPDQCSEVWQGRNCAPCPSVS